jgi:hypothetical protein
MPDLPSGTVTFLFTDIEENSAQTPQRPDSEHAGTITGVAGVARADPPVNFRHHGGQERIRSRRILPNHHKEPPA